MDILSGKSVRRKECKNDSPPFTPDELVDIWNSRNKKIRGCVTRSASENSVDALDGVEDDETDVDDNNVVVIVGGPEDHYQQQAMKSPSESFSSSPGRIRRGALKLTAQDEAFLTSMILSDRGAPFLSQFYYCFSRSMLQQFRKSTSLGLELSVGMFSGLMIGMTFIDTR